MMVKTLFALLLMICPAISFAGGFQVNLQGTAQTGMGHTGAGLAIDASAQFFNPGALAFTRSSISLGTTPIFAKISYLEPSPGTYTTTNESTISTPFAAYGAYRFGKGTHKVSLGASVYTPFGSRVLYADDWKGQFAIREISLKAIFIQPTIAYNFNDKIGIGGGPVFATGDVLVRRAVPAQFSDGSYGEASLSGAGNGMGYNIGLFYNMSENLRFGFSYRSKVAFDASDGQANFTVPSDLQEFFPNTTFASSIQLPWTATLGASYTLESSIVHTFALDINYVGWSLYQSLDFDFADNTDKLEDSSSPRNYENAFAFRAGWQGGISKMLTVRAGAYLDMTPVPDGFTTPETPDANKIGLSAGATATFGNFNVHASLLWVEGMKRTDINQEMNFGGTYKGRALIPGIGLSYIFQPKPDPVVIIDP